MLPTEKHTIRVRLQNFTYYDVNPFQSNFNLFSRIFDRPNPLFDRGQCGINFPYLFPGTKNPPTKIPTVALGSPYTELSGSRYPSSSSGPIYDISNNVTKIINNHTVKFGFLWERAGQTTSIRST